MDISKIIFSWTENDTLVVCPQFFYPFSKVLFNWKQYADAFAWITMMMWSLTKSHILTWEIRWALGSFTMNKANEADRILVKQF